MEWNGLRGWMDGWMDACMMQRLIGLDTHKAVILVF